MLLNQSTCIEIHSQKNNDMMKENNSVYSSGITTINEIEPPFPQLIQQEKNHHHRNSYDTTISSLSSSSINTSYSSATTPRTLRNSLSHFTSTSIKQTSTHPPLPNFHPIPPPSTYPSKYYYHNNPSLSTLTLNSDYSNNKDQHRLKSHSHHQISQWWGSQKQKWKQFRHKKIKC
ncbi:unnamed protein product [Cunninghamella blakesleeana]